jgi:hypothetical protein
MNGIVVVDEDGNLGSDGGALHGRVTNAEGDIQTLKTTKVDKTRLDSFGPNPAGPVGSLERWAGGVNGTLTTHNAQISQLYTLSAQQGAMLSDHSRLLTDHTNQLGEHGKAIAISLSMPDAWLSDKKRFGIFGSVGGFGDETALGFAAIGRIDNTWSVNAKFGTDTSFDQFGWQIGAGAQW